ncbi:MAG: hypothetical protein JOY70_02405 [Acidisphaera sp.]|nr:hypothetical protein [Acidisphaera sp.]
MSGGAVLLVYLFVVLVNPWGDLPVSWPVARWPVDGNARYSFPFLARSADFDSAVLGSSTSRLFRPELLNRVFDGRFANLAMNSATAYEQSSLLGVFVRAHPAPRVVIIGLEDVRWCVPPSGLVRHTPEFAFPDWLYDGSRWGDYLHMADLYAVERAGQAFAEWTGLKRRVYGRDGYTRFVPDESRYDPARVAELMAPAKPWEPPDEGPDPERWQMPALDLLREDLTRLPAATRKLMVFVPVSTRLIAPPTTRGGAWFAECKRRVVDLARGAGRAAVTDLAFASPLTSDPAHYWDAWHTRVGIADRVVTEIAARLAGSASDDVRVLFQSDAGTVVSRSE